MSRVVLLLILGTAFLLILACLGPAVTPTPNPAILTTPTVLSLTVTAQPNTYTTINQKIIYTYVVKNNSTAQLQGPLSLADNKITVVSCPNINNLNSGESVTCTAEYFIKQEDLVNGSMVNTTTASIGGQTSNTVTTTIQATLPKVLTMTATPSTTTFNQANQNINFTFAVANPGPNTLGPDQFWVKVDRIPSPIACGPASTTLATGQSVPCNGTYTTTAADLGAPSIVFTITATGAGVTTVQPMTVTVSNLTVSPSPGATVPSNLTPGTTVQHQVQKGEWLLQISRCYGANFDAVKSANPRIDPNLIFPYPTMTVTVPNIGSSGTIYGPVNCVIFYKVVSGDTWQSIANKFNADLAVLMAANPGVTLSPGVEIKVPNNSRQSGTPPAPIPTIPTAITPATPIPTTPVPTQPIPLNFPPGNPSTATDSRTISTPGTLRYSFAASSGQILSVKLTAATNDIGLGIYGPNNTTLKPADSVTSWSGTLTATGTYFIDLVSSTGAPSKQFTLQVTLTTPAPASPAERVADLYPGPESSKPSYLSAFNGQLYFQAVSNNNLGAELWKYDRATNAPSFVSDMYIGPVGSEPAYLRPYIDNMLYFSANGNKDNSQTGAELWRFNGSDTGRVLDLFPGPEGSKPAYMVEYKGEMYFSANGNNSKGIELWKFNASTSQPAFVWDINEGPGNSSPSYLTVYNNILYFAATTTNGGTELWQYDGTTPKLAQDIIPGAGNSSPAFLTVFNNLLYFSADGNNGAGTELWRYDGINAPTMASDVNPGPTGSAPTYLTVFNNALFFGASGSNNDFELWKFDGTTSTLAANINPSGSSGPAFLTVYNNELYFQANANDGAGIELWRYKGP